MTPPARIAVMISGGGRTLETIAGAIDEGALHAQIELVVASRACPGVDKAMNRGLPVEIIPGEIEAQALDRLMHGRGVEWIVLGGYLRFVNIPARYRGKVVNIHPALLPSFGGPGMYGERVHEAVLATGAHESGCTVHLCDEAYDRGPILAQSRCPVVKGDTPETLGARVFELEQALYPQVLEDLVRGRLDPRDAPLRMESP